MQALCCSVWPEGRGSQEQAPPKHGGVKVVKVVLAFQNVVLTHNLESESQQKMANF